MQTQDSAVVVQFKHGIRAFEAEIWTNPNDTSVVDGKSLRIDVFVTKGTGTNTIGKTLINALKDLQMQMQTSHSQGYCIFRVRTPDKGAIKNPNDPNDIAYPHIKDYKAFYERFNAITNYLEKQGILPDKPITSSTTLADVRGKIILQLELPGATTPAEQKDQREAWESLHAAKSLFSISIPAFSSANPLYSPLVYGTYPNDNQYCSEDGKTNIHEQSIELNEDMWYIHAETQPSTGNSEALMKAMVESISKWYRSSYHNKYFMTYLGGVGWDANYPSTIGSTYAQRWMDYVTVDKKTDLANKPYGLVYFNWACAGEGEKVNEAVKMVINRNGQDGFLLNGLNRNIPNTGE